MWLSFHFLVLCLRGRFLVQIILLHDLLCALFFLRSCKGFFRGGFLWRSLRWGSWWLILWNLLAFWLQSAWGLHNTVDKLSLTIYTLSLLGLRVQGRPIFELDCFFYPHRVDQVISQLLFLMLQACHFFLLPCDLGAHLFHVLLLVAWYWATEGRVETLLLTPQIHLTIAALDVHGLVMR